MSEQPGIEYHDADWPYGLSCPECGHILQEGDRYSQQLEAFQNDIPILGIVCSVCALGGQRGKESA